MPWTGHRHRPITKRGRHDCLSIDTEEAVAYRELDRAAALRDIRTQVERVEQGDVLTVGTPDWTDLVPTRT